MRVGIITKIGKNYGAVLQAYALKTYLERMGLNASIINYMHKQSKKTYRVCPYKWGPRGTIANIKSLMRFSVIKKSSKKFDEFKNMKLNLLGEYESYDQLLTSPPDCNIYISGSDQVWNPTISFDPAYYLTFGSDKVKRASYAASIGVTQIPNDIKDEFKKRLSIFDLISVREETAKQTLSEFGIDAKTAVDPTLLLDSREWNKIAIDPPITKPFILCYMVSTPDYVQQLIALIKRQTGLPVYNIVTSSYPAPIGDYQIWDAGPEEFVGYFKNAHMVITSSFHGTVFSVIYRKPFVSMLYKATGSRVSDLLSNLGLQDRIVEDVGSYNEDLLKINFDEATNKLGLMKSNSKEIINQIVSLTNL